MSEPVFFILDTKRLERGADACNWLGRIVKNYHSPGASFTPSNPAPFTQDNVKSTPETDVEEKVQGSRSGSLRARLTEIFGLVKGSTTTDTIDFKTSSVLSVRLQNQDKIFKKLVQDDEIKKDLMEMLPIGSHCFFIVGLLIWKDAVYTTNKEATKTREGHATLPIATETGLPGLRVQAEAAASTSARVEGSATSPGERIFAFEYRVVRRSAISLFSREFNPKLSDKGPRFKGDKVYAGSEESEQESFDESVIFELEEEDCVWIDAEDEGDRPIEHDLGGIILSYKED